MADHGLEIHGPAIGHPMELANTPEETAKPMSLKIDVPHPDDLQPAEPTSRLAVRLHIDYNSSRKAIVLSVCEVETRDGYEIIPLSSMKFYSVVPCLRRNARQLSEVAARLRPFAPTIAACYREGDSHADSMRQIIAAAVAV